MSFVSDQPIVEPSWRGHLDTRIDALHLIHAARLGYIKLVPRRPSAGEMRQIVDAGALFVFEVKGSFNNWNDYSTQWTHLNNGMRRGGYTNSVSATVVPEFRKKITRFQIGTIRYQVVCYHDDVSKGSDNLSRFPKPVIANSIPTDQCNTSTTLNFRLKGCNDHGCEIYEWVKTADQASETSELLEDEAHERQHSRSSLPLPATCSSPSQHEELVSALYPEENLTYKYKYRYKTTIRNSQMQVSQDGESRYDMLSEPDQSASHARQNAFYTGASQYPASSRSPVSPRRTHGYTQSPVSPVSPQRDYYSHLGAPGPRYKEGAYVRQHGDATRSSPPITRSPANFKTRVDPYDRDEKWDARHERNISAPITPGNSASTPMYAVHGRAFSHSGFDAYGRPLAYQTYYPSSPPPPPTSTSGYRGGHEYEEQGPSSHTSTGHAPPSEYGNAPQRWRIIAPAPTSYVHDGAIPPASELIDGAIRKEREREKRTGREGDISP